jgi:hypothetical protein
MKISTAQNIAPDCESVKVDKSEELKTDECWALEECDVASATCKKHLAPIRKILFFNTCISFKTSVPAYWKV